VLRDQIEYERENRHNLEKQIEELKKMTVKLMPLVKRKIEEMKKLNGKEL
jgi:hypothetical protein